MIYNVNEINGIEDQLFNMRLKERKNIINRPYKKVKVNKDNVYTLLSILYERIETCAYRRGIDDKRG